MKQTKNLLVTMAMLLCSLTTSAEEVQIEGLGYYLNANAKTAKVIGNIINPYRGDITIPSTVIYNGVEYSVTSIGDDAFGACRNVTSITISEGVTSIGNEAFSCCYQLASIAIPNSVTSIGEHAFKNCRSLTAITIPSSVTGIGDDAFSGCSNLTTVIAHVTWKKIFRKKWYDIFEGCPNLKKITYVK